MQYNGYTSVMMAEGEQYPGDWQIQMHLESTRDISPFSVLGEREFVLPRGVQLEYRGIRNGYRIMGERMEKKSVKKSRQFADDEKEIEAWINMGYTREHAIEILREMEDTRARWTRERGQPISDQRRQRLRDIRERMKAEAFYGLEE